MLSVVNPRTAFLGGIALFVIVTCGADDRIGKNTCVEATDNCPNEHITFYLYTKYVRQFVVDAIRARS